MNKRNEKKREKGWWKEEKEIFQIQLKMGDDWFKIDILYTPRQGWGASTFDCDSGSCFLVRLLIFFWRCPVPVILCKVYNNTWASPTSRNFYWYKVRLTKESNQTATSNSGWNRLYIGGRWFISHQLLQSRELGRCG